MGITSQKAPSQAIFGRYALALASLLNLAYTILRGSSGPFAPEGGSFSRSKSTAYPDFTYLHRYSMALSAYLKE
jgi:hypothetical protein